MELLKMKHHDLTKNSWRMTHPKTLSTKKTLISEMEVLRVWKIDYFTHGMSWRWNTTIWRKIRKHWCIWTKKTWVSEMEALEVWEIRLFHTWNVMKMKHQDLTKNSWRLTHPKPSSTKKTWILEMEVFGVWKIWLLNTWIVLRMKQHNLMKNTYRLTYPKPLSTKETWILEMKALGV